MYEQACMVATKDKYYTNMMETIVYYNDHNNAPLSNEKLWKEVSRVMAETEEEELDAKRNVNNVTMDNLFHWSSATTNTKGEIKNVTNERQISSDIMAETINWFNGFTIQSTINDSAYYDSEENDAESDPNSDPKVATHTTKRNYLHKLLTNREIPEIIQGFIPPVKQTTLGGVATSRRGMNAVRAVLRKEIFTGATRSTAGVLKDPPGINGKDTGGTITVDRNTVGIPPRTTTQVRTGTRPSFPPTSIGSQKIEGPRRSIILQ